MNKYSAMSSTEFNRAVAEELGWTEVKYERVGTILDEPIYINVGISPESTIEIIVPDYCGDMNAAYSLTDGMSCAFFRVENQWDIHFDEGCSAKNKSLSRAIVECFMLWRDAQKEVKS